MNERTNERMNEHLPFSEAGGRRANFYFFDVFLFEVECGAREVLPLHFREPQKGI